MILPPSTLAILGGGQLGRFFVAAAHEMGYTVWALDPDAESPAGRIADRHIVAPFDDPNALAEIANHCAAVTTEFENVPAATLAFFEERIAAHPSANAVAICQNRITEKQFLRDCGFPCGDFAVIRTEADITAADNNLFPGILKVARFGYDGKGQAAVQTKEETFTAYRALSHPGLKAGDSSTKVREPSAQQNNCLAHLATNGEDCARHVFKGEAAVLEKKLTLDCEVSVVLARDVHGNVKSFPVAENRHTNGILDVSIVPARVSGPLAEEARIIAEHIAAKLGYVGVLAVEFFVSDGRLFVNEIAPRPHNSGHYTLDACTVSQYEQQVRAVCGLPLHEPRAHSACVMVNLLGDIWFDKDGKIREPDWNMLYAVPNLVLRLYGKRRPRHGRKMGHFTVVGDCLDDVLSAALAVRDQGLGIRD